MGRDSINLSTHIMDEFSLQKTDRFQCQQVVHQEGVGVFQSTDDTPEDEADVWIFVTGIESEGTTEAGCLHL